MELSLGISQEEGRDVGWWCLSDWLKTKRARTKVFKIGKAYSQIGGSEKTRRATGVIDDVGI